MGSPYFAAVLADTPVAYYRLGEASGTTATDASGNRHDVQYTEQRSFESSLGSLVFYGSRWYSPVLGRFLQRRL